MTDLEAVRHPNHGALHTSRRWRPRDQSPATPHRVTLKGSNLPSPGPRSGAEVDVTQHLCHSEQLCDNGEEQDDVGSTQPALYVMTSSNT